MRSAFNLGSSLANAVKNEYVRLMSVSSTDPLLIDNSKNKIFERDRERDTQPIGW